MAVAINEEINQPTSTCYYPRSYIYFKNNAAAPRVPPESPWIAFLITGTFAVRIKCGGNAFGSAS